MRRPAGMGCVWWWARVGEGCARLLTQLSPGLLPPWPLARLQAKDGRSGVFDMAAASLLGPEVRAKPPTHGIATPHTRARPLPLAPRHEAWGSAARTSIPPPSPLPGVCAQATVLTGSALYTWGTRAPTSDGVAPCRLAPDPPPAHPCSQAAAAKRPEFKSRGGSWQQDLALQNIQARMRMVRHAAARRARRMCARPARQPLKDEGTLWPWVSERPLAYPVSAERHAGADFLQHHATRWGVTVLPTSKSHHLHHTLSSKTG